MNQEYVVQATAGSKTKSCEVTVEALERADATASERFRVVLDGQERIVEVRRFDERGSVVSFSLIDADGKQHLLDIDGGLPDFKLSLGGRDPLQLKVQARRDLLTTASSQAGLPGSGEVRAAMPGKVVKLLCQVGDTVKAGQGLLVIEAMKMENELRAPVAGKVSALHVREGQAVEHGQALAVLSS